MPGVRWDQEHEWFCPFTYNSVDGRCLSQMGCVTILQAALEKARAGRTLAGAEADMVARVSQIGYDLISHLPRSESVAAGVLYQT